MSKLTPTQELTRLRQLVTALESGSKIVRGGMDVTKEELQKLRAEIAFLEKTMNTPDEGSGSPKK